MISRDEAVALIDTRVRVAWGGEPRVALLRAVTPTGMLILAGPGGVETLVELDTVRSIEDARYTCSKCGARCNRIYGSLAEITGSCSECYRDWAKRQPVPRETCPDCGELGAVYSPKYKAWRCPTCHAKNRSFSGSSVESAVLTALCRSADKDSPLHDWKQMKSQYVCRVCQVKVFGKPAGA